MELACRVSLLPLILSRFVIIGACGLSIVSSCGKMVGAQSSSASAAAAELWLTPVETFSLKDRNPRATADLEDMFQAQAPWARAAANVNVIQSATKLLLMSSDRMMGTELQYLASRGISYALETSLLIDEGTCGRRVEGFTSQDCLSNLPKKFKG